MSDRNHNANHHPANSSGPPLWSAPKPIDGAVCRQCRLCLKWFHIGWIAYHGCKTRKPRSH